MQEAGCQVVNLLAMLEEENGNLRIALIELLLEIRGALCGGKRQCVSDLFTLTGSAAMAGT